ncbi:MAG TPA: uroporphyrinogen-III C-methyltransferase, partial [Hanamia sp.]
MSSETILDVVEKLTQHHIHEEKLMAVIEQATTPLQNVHIENLYDFKRKDCEPSFISPTLIIIGRVVALHENYKWLENNTTKNYYFKPLNSQLILNNQPEKITHVS